MTEAEVVDWLAGHPEFFLRHPEMLAANLLDAEAPQVNNIISLPEAELTQLRRKNQELREQLAGMLERIRRNEEIYQAFHRVQVAMIRAGDAEELIRVATGELEQAFAIRQVTVVLSDRFAWPAPGEGAWRVCGVPEGIRNRCWCLDHVILTEELGTTGRCVVRVGLEGTRRESFFGEASPDIRSEALVPLFQDGALIGSLNLGGRIPSRFLPGNATDLVENLAEVLAVCLRMPNLSRGGDDGGME